MTLRQRLRAALLLAAGAALLLGMTGTSSTPEQPSLALDPSLRNDPAVRLALADLQAALAAPGATPLKRVTVGQPADAGVKQAAAKRVSDLDTLGGEDYVIRPLPGDDPGVLLVGGGPLGVAYGMLELADDVRQRRPYLASPVERRVSPDFSLRMVSDPLDPRYPGSEQALRWGYNAVMTEPWPALALYDSLDPAIYDAAKYPEARAWVEAKRRLARQEVQQAKALHLQVIAPGDVISLPQQVAALYGADVTDGVTGRYCIERPRTRALLAAAIDELFTAFPEVDGILVRTGENYPAGPLAGNTPVDGACPGRTDSLAETLRFLQGEVVGKHGRRLIYRGWDLGAGGMHAAGGGARLAAAFPTQQNTLLSFKVTETDFWRYNRLNPNLLDTPFDRMVELQAAREYEGKGAFPDFVAAIHGQGLPEVLGDRGLPAAHAAGVRAAWVWAKGGGWDGPFVSNPLWVEANAAALGKLLWRSTADPGQLARDWAAARFGPDAAAPLGDLLLGSPHAILNGFYLGCYARTHGPWTPNTLWVRDDQVSGTAKLRELYDGCGGAGSIDDVAAEKAAAVDDVLTMQRLLQSADPALTDRTLAATVAAGLEYERTLLECFQHYVTGMFRWFAYQDGGSLDAPLRAQASTDLERARLAWQAHQATGLLPNAPSPFRDAGITAAIDAALEGLATPPEQARAIAPAATRPR